MRCVTCARSDGDRVGVLAGEPAQALPAGVRLIEAFLADTFLADTEAVANA
jgi:hypothetical protein